MSTIAGAAVRATANGKNPPLCVGVFLLLPLPNIKRFLLFTYGRLIPLPESSTRSRLTRLTRRRRRKGVSRCRLRLYILVTFFHLNINFVFDFSNAVFFMWHDKTVFS